MTIPYETHCPSCGAPPERVTKKHWDKGTCTNEAGLHRVRIDYSEDMDGWRYGFSYRVTEEHITFTCEVCGKRWAEEVKFGGWTPDKTAKASARHIDITALQEALSSDETSASVLVDKAVEKVCDLVTENARLRKVRSSFQDETYRAGKELDRLRDEVTQLQSRCLTEEGIKALQEALCSEETSASVLVDKAVRYIEGQQRAIELDRDRLLGFIEENHKLLVEYHKMKTWRDVLAGDRKTLFAENQKLRAEAELRRK